MSLDYLSTPLAGGTISKDGRELNFLRSNKLKLYIFGPDKNGVVKIEHDDGRIQYQYNTGEYGNLDYKTHTVDEYPFLPKYERPIKKSKIGRCRTRVKR